MIFNTASKILPYQKNAHDESYLNMCSFLVIGTFDIKLKGILTDSI